MSETAPPSTGSDPAVALPPLSLAERLRRLIGDANFTRYEEFWRENLAKYPRALGKIIAETEVRQPPFVTNLGAHVAVRISKPPPKSDTAP